jgi:WD40 repeat protein/tetratricopeptide (TPR) repeat protein
MGIKTMNDRRLKSLDECLAESEDFENQFKRFFGGEGGGSVERAQLVADLTFWLQGIAWQGRFLPLGSADRRAFRSVLERWGSRLRRQGLYLEGIDSLVDFDPRAGIVLTGDCPYPGLDPYTDRLRHSFFGRETLVADCVARLEQQGNRILLITGASGSGKSSLALAGILPQLVDRHDGSWVFAPRLTPGTCPLAELAQAIAQAIGHPDQATEIERSLRAAPDDALGQLAELCQDKPLMLIVDQFEELLTLCRDSGEQSGFSQVICALSDPNSSAGDFCCRILLTLRTDHLTRFESDRALKPLHIRLIGEANAQGLSAMGLGDIKRAIKEPAQGAGLRFVPVTLIDQLASQTAGLSNGLPLLQFALRRLWDTRPRNESREPLDLITEEMVNALPDVQGALGKVAKGVFDTLSASQQRICERLLQELMVLDETFEEPLRRRRNEAELRGVLQARFPATGDVDDVNKVISDFVAAGLLRRFGDESGSQLEVAHEALLRHWGHIYGLVTEAEVKERLHLIKQIGREAREWVSRGKADDYLSLRGERLHRAIACAEDGWLADAEFTAYIEACRKQEEVERLTEQRAKEERERADAAEKARDVAQLQAEREHFRRNMWAVAVVAVLILAVGLGWGWYSLYRASEEALVQKLTQAVEGEFDRDFAQRSLLLAIEAANHGKTGTGALLPGVERALRSAIRAPPVRALIKSYGGTLIYGAAYAPDGLTLALGDSLGGVSLWDVATGRERKALFAHVDAVRAITYSPDGRKMASGSDDGKIVVWDIDSDKPVQVLNAHVDRVNGLAFSRPDGKLLASASSDGSVRLWDVSTGKQVRTLYGHAGGVQALAFGRDERQLATAGADNRVVVWNAQESRVLYSLRTERLFDLDFSVDGSLLAVADGDQVQIWDTATRGRRSTLTGHTNSVIRVRFSRDQRQVATASYDGTVRVWRLPRDDRDKQGQAVQTTRFPPETVRFNSLALSPTGDTVAATVAITGTPSRSTEGAATIWNVAGGGELLTLEGWETAVEAVAFSPDDRSLIAAGGNDGRVQTWDLTGTRRDVPFKDTRTSTRALAYCSKGLLAIGDGNDTVVLLPGEGTPLRLSGHRDVVYDLAFSPDGSRIVSASKDGSAIAWELPSGKQQKVLDKDAAPMMAVAYSADGKTIATTSEGKSIKLWRDGTWELLREIKVRKFDMFLDLAFTADSRKLVSSGMDKKVRIWDLDTGAEVCVLKGHTEVVSAVAISGNHLATAADDGIRLWDLRSYDQVEAFAVRSHGIRSLAFSPNGRYLAAGARDGVVRVYVMQAEELVKVATTRVRRGWTREECRQFLPGIPCPRSRYSLLDEAHERFEECDFKGGERLLRQAKGGEPGQDELIHAEVDALLGTAFLRAASIVLKNPEDSAEVAKGEKPEKAAYRLLVDAKDKSTNLVFDPSSRRNDLCAYRDVTRARELALEGMLVESIAAFQHAHDEGWDMPGEPEDVAWRLVAIKVLTYAWEDLQTGSTSSLPLIYAEALELILERFPDLGPGHRVLAELYARDGDFYRAKDHYLKAASKELGAEPLVLLAKFMLKLDPQQAADFARQALAHDRGSDEAWFTLGLAEYALGNKQGAVEAFDQVTLSADFFVDALNYAGAICFDYLGKDQAASQRLTRAVQVAPNNLSVLSNYAEFLLASGRHEQAKLAAGRAREHAEAKRPDNAGIRAAMSFVLFCAELLSGEHKRALAELNALERDVKAATEALESLWSFDAIERSLERMLKVYSWEKQKAVLKVLQFVKTNGREGTLDDMRQLLSSQ